MEIVKALVPILGSAAAAMAFALYARRRWGRKSPDDARSSWDADFDWGGGDGE